MYLFWWLAGFATLFQASFNIYYARDSSALIGFEVWLAILDFILLYGYLQLIRRKYFHRYKNINTGAFDPVSFSSLWTGTHIPRLAPRAAPTTNPQTDQTAKTDTGTKTDTEVNSGADVKTNAKKDSDSKPKSVQMQPLTPPPAVASSAPTVPLLGNAHPHPGYSGSAGSTPFPSLPATAYHTPAAGTPAEIDPQRDSIHRT